MVEAGFALIFAYFWVGLMEAIDRFERPSDRPEYETAQPEFETAPSFSRTLHIILFFPFSRTLARSPLRSLLKVLVHAAIVYAGAYGLSLMFDRVVLGLAVFGLLICVVAFFYILTSTTRLS